MNRASDLRSGWLARLGALLPEGLEPLHLRLLALVTVGMAFEQYDMSLLNSAINHVARDLGMDPGEIGFVAGVIRAGGLLTFGLVALADRLGRRRLFLAALAGVGMTTLATAFVQTAWQFAAIQVFSRALSMTVFVTGIVMVVEEFPAAHRGFGVGVLAALAAAGYGGGLVLFAGVDWFPYGWRALYALGIVPLLLVPLLRRALGETARFTRSRAEATEAPTGGLLAPALDLARTQPRRALALGAAGFLIAAGTISALQYLTVFVQEVHGWPPWQVSAVLVAGGAVGVLGNVVGGRLSDRIGRRGVGCGAYLLQPVAAAALFYAPPVAVAAAFAAAIFLHAAGDVMLRALGSELFATRHRATALGWLVLLQTLGWTTGLLVASRGIASHADIPATVATLSLLTGLGALAILALPEGGRRELESLSEEGS